MGSSDGNPKRNRLRICQPRATCMIIHFLKQGAPKLFRGKSLGITKVGGSGPKRRNFGNFVILLFRRRPVRFSTAKSTWALRCARCFKDMACRDGLLQAIFSRDPLVLGKAAGQSESTICKFWGGFWLQRRKSQKKSAEDLSAAS